MQLKPFIQLTASITFAILLTGCVTTREEGSSVVSSISTKSPVTFNGGQSIGNQGVMPMPRMGYAIEEPIPYRMPEKVRVVEVAGYRNENGEVILPTRKIVVEEEARWNMDAVRSPHRAYVEPEHLNALPSSSTVDYNRADSAEPTAMIDSIPTRELTTMDNIDITGLFRKDQERAAAAMAKADQQAVWDPDLGWILMPSTQTIPDVLLNP